MPVTGDSSRKQIQIGVYSDGSGWITQNPIEKIVEVILIHLL